MKGFPKRMRRLVLAGSTLVLIAVGYVASPLWTAWQIREALHRADTVYIAGKVEWDSVRSTLRQSLKRGVLDFAGVDAADGLDPSRTSLWQRLKVYAGRSAADAFVDRYVTPEGLPRLVGYRKAYRERIKGEIEPEKTLANLPGRLARFWSRVRRAEFITPFRFEVEMADRDDANRRIVSTLELKGLEWKLTELRMHRTDTIAPVAVAAPL